MAWQITRNGVEHTVDVEALGDDLFAVTVDGERHELRAGTPEAGVLSLLRGELRQEADVVVDGSSVSVTVAGQRHDLTVVDERELALRALGLGGGGGADNIVSTSMPGKVVTLLVQKGDRVEVGQGVIVVEAMKMENELKAAAAGVVASIAVAVGDAVEGGATLLVIEPDSD